VTSTRSTAQSAARQLLRQSLLEAARQLLRERPWPEITMSHLATAAGVSRQTLYNEFGTRQGFVEAYLLYDADRILSVVEQAIESAGGDPAVTIEVAFSQFLETMQDDPLAVSVLAGTDNDGLLPLVTTRGGPVLAIAAYRLGGAIQRSWPQAAPEDVQLLAEELVRLALSHAMLPQGDIAAAAKQVAVLLTPFAVQALAK
jgi:AcrR family transcriptional regulator